MLARINYLTWSAITTTLIFGVIACQPPKQSTTSTEETTSAKALPGEGVKVHPAHGGLPEESFRAEIVSTALKQLGYQVEPVSALDYSAKLLAIANGDLDYTVTHWEKNHKGFFEKSGGEQKLERVGAIIPRMLQGYQIDKKTADDYQINNLAQLKDPKIAKLFDSNGDGKANLVGCDPGWGCEGIIEYHLEAYGLQDNVTHDQGKYPALIADVVTRYRQGEPVLYYTWTPYWLGAVLKPDEDVVWLEVPNTDLPEAQGELTVADTSIEGKNLGFPVDRMRIVASQQFLSANPSAKHLFELMEISPEDMSAESLRIKEGEDRPEDIRRHAEEWIERHQELFDSWVEQAKKAG
ncbi:MAG: glycine betaine/L-proline ABC transporter substrate-binding protein ProX [Symploca sp. SIO2E6]|nr:glycine betaine/L-proline ABC transporter substrate-binding protein ProX [Symploca sp. SIO2E6]